MRQLAWKGVSVLQLEKLSRLLFLEPKCVCCGDASRLRNQVQEWNISRLFPSGHVPSL